MEQRTKRPHPQWTCPVVFVQTRVLELGLDSSCCIESLCGLSCEPISDPIIVRPAVFLALLFGLSLCSVFGCHLNIACYFKIRSECSPPFLFVRSPARRRVLALGDSRHVSLMCCLFSAAHRFHLYKPTQQPFHRHSNLSGFPLMFKSICAARTTVLPHARFVRLIAGMLEISTPSQADRGLLRLCIDFVFLASNWLQDLTDIWHHTGRHTSQQPNTLHMLGSYRILSPFWS